MIEPTDKQVLDIMPCIYSKAYYNEDGTKKSEEQLNKLFEFFKDIKRRKLNETGEEKEKRLKLQKERREKLKNRNENNNKR